MHNDEPVDENTRSMHAIRVDGAELDDFRDLGDGEIRRHGHHRIKVACGFPIDEIAPAVSPQRLDQGNVTAQRHFEHIPLAVDLAQLFAFGELGADRDRRVEAAEPGRGAAHALAQGPLREQLELDASRLVLCIEAARRIA